MIAWRAALEQVFHLQGNPQSLHAMQQAPLPSGMASLMRLVSDSAGLLQEVADSHAIPATQLQTYIAEYLLAVCLYPNSSSLRVLGLNDSKNIALAKEHHRLLLKWLHPDRNPHNKQHAERVNQAWTLLKNSHGDDEQIQSLHELSNPRHEHPPLPKSRFPLFLVGLLALSVMLLAISFWPDDAVYVFGSEGVAQQNSDAETNDDKNDPELSWLERLKNPSKPESKPSAATATAVSPDVADHKPAKKEKPVATQKLMSEQNMPPISIEPMIKASDVFESKNTEASTSEAPVAERSVVQNTVARKNNSDQNALPNTEQAQQLLAQFSQAYQGGNLTQFMALFSAQARNNRGDRLAIEQDYRKLFSNSTRRSIRFSELQWRLKDNTVLHAQYYTQVKWQNKWLQVTNQGPIQFMFIHENGKLRIQQILLEE